MKINEMLNLNNIDEHERSVMEEKKIEFKKKFSKLSSDSRKDAKDAICLYCKKKTTNFCNSHSLPASFLKNIALNGKCYINNEIVDLPLMDSEKGVNNSGTFHLICKECDNKIFKEYETIENYETIPTDKMIAQIALKNYLKSISKRRLEMALYRNTAKGMLPPNADPKMLEGFVEHLNKINQLELNEYYRGFDRAKKIIQKDWRNEYYLFYHEKLEYRVPIAFQYQVALIVDLEGNVINKVYNNDPNYKLQLINICVFPLKNSSIIMLFIDKDDKRYRSFYKQFKKLSREDKLAAINFIIFRYSEEVFISKTVQNDTLNDPNLKDISGITGAQLSNVSSPDENLLIENSKFDRMYDIPNFLTMQMSE
ncbi:hypothetical protein DSLASN_03820 [Desulfoluna limicola]|uniref:HNH endonuclease n=1 Tax=Desulfoluna limicola TaxID=2810562 RepID=A0ABM7PC62_9BACT|nr:hypothetical protein [Desulfoluna limicola]BCS94750.1 hypothetical protein DSLASN_03820 [Desulfoluna limicola]